uniref:Uncharacterized protein n=1 Tax=Timema cristinae TaxID=61476 RepID=A0A7R9DII2_TIMCR|nr:unnamed protein product [Timema cristinae]
MRVRDPLSPKEWGSCQSHVRVCSNSNGCLIITADHFSLFTVILEEPYPEVMKRIRCRTGGRLRMDEVPGVEIMLRQKTISNSSPQVEFPRGCLESDVDAYLRVLFDSEPQLEKSSRALASPIIMLGPHGHQFDTNRPPVSLGPLPVLQPSGPQMADRKDLNETAINRRNDAISGVDKEGQQ